MEKNELNRKIRAHSSKIILQTIILIIFIIILFYSIMPSYDEYKTNKESLISKITSYEKLEKNWLTYQEFLSMIDDKETKVLVTKIWQEFYNNNLSNSSWSYIKFLETKEKKVNELKKSDKIKIRDAKLSKVLPLYQEWVTLDGVMTDLEFVNYVEKLLRIFKLRTNSSIWIKNLILVQDEDMKNNKKVTQNISAQIFYIPLKLDLEWTKWDIMDFIYFLQNVWKVETIKQDSLSFYRDNVLNNRWVENIYESKLVDIEWITFFNYIDTSSSLRTTYSEKTTMWLLNFVRNWVDKDQVYKIEIDLRFYVKWLPNYKIENFISEVSLKYKNLSKEISQTLKTLQSKNTKNFNWDNLNIIANIKNIEIFLNDKKDEIKSYDAWLKQKEGLDKIYLQAAKMKFDLENLESIYKENTKKINK